MSILLGSGVMIIQGRKPSYTRQNLVVVLGTFFSHLPTYAASYFK